MRQPEAYAAGERYFPEAHYAAHPTAHDEAHPIAHDATAAPPTFYTPTGRGLEGQIKDKLAHLASLDKAARDKKG